VSVTICDHLCSPPSDVFGYFPTNLLSGQLKAPPVLRVECLHLLECLEVQGMVPPAVLVFLTEAPSLVELSLCSFVFTGDEEVEALTTGEDLNELATAIEHGDVVPELRKFECDLNVADSFLDMLEERAKSGDELVSPHKTIESVVIHGPQGEHADVRASLLALRDQGVNLVFQS